MKNQIKKLNKLIKENPKLDVRMLIENTACNECVSYILKVYSIEIQDYAEYCGEPYLDFDAMIDDIIWKEHLMKKYAKQAANPLIHKVILVKFRRHKSEI